MSRVCFPSRRKSRRLHRFVNIPAKNLGILKPRAFAEIFGVSYFRVRSLLPCCAASNAPRLERVVLSFGTLLSSGSGDWRDGHRKRCVLYRRSLLHRDASSHRRQSRRSADALRPAWEGRYAAPRQHGAGLFHVVLPDHGTVRRSCECLSTLANSGCRSFRSASRNSIRAWF